MAPKPHTTQRQIDANRANAAKSTGPRTQNGKNDVSQNATKTGIYGGLRPIPRGVFREDPAQIAALIDDVVTSLAPRDGIERLACDEIAKMYLRGRRFGVLESHHYAAIGRLGHDLLTTEDIERIAEQAKTFTIAAAILAQDLAGLSQAQLRYVRDAQAHLDPSIVTLTTQNQAEPEIDPAGLTASLDRTHGSVEAARLRFISEAAELNAKLPDPVEEARVAEEVTRHVTKDGTLERYSLISTRLGADLDRALRQYRQLNARKIPRIDAHDTESHDEAAVTDQPESDDPLDQTEVDAGT